jgi:hypothetical protein
VDSLAIGYDLEKDRDSSRGSHARENDKPGALRGFSCHSRSGAGVSPAIIAGETPVSTRLPREESRFLSRRS